METSLYIRQSTQGLHRALERSALAQGLMSPHLTLQGYCKALIPWSRAWQLVESAIDRSADKAHCALLIPSRRWHLALSDLQVLGQGTAPASLATAHHPYAPLAPAASLPELLGMCYVLRGAALGGAVIAAHIRKTVPLAPGTGTLFFDAADPQALSWRQWTTDFDARVAGAPAQAQALHGASRTFEKLLQIFSAKASPETARTMPTDAQGLHA